MSVFFRALIVVQLMAMIACSNSPIVSRCREICARESTCAEEVDIEMDRAECVAECAMLERNEAARDLVEKHMSCVDNARDCGAVLDCE